MNVIELLRSQLFGSEWIAIEPTPMAFVRFDGSGAYSVVLAREYQYRPLFGGKRWRGTYMYTFHPERKSEALTK